MRVLLVEDDSKISSFLRKGLREAGFAVDHAADGEHGLHLALYEAYDAAIVDIMLPKRDGLRRSRGAEDQRRRCISGQAARVAPFGPPNLARLAPIRSFYRALTPFSVCCVSRFMNFSNAVKVE